MTVEMTVTHIATETSASAAPAKKYDYRLIRVRKADGRETTVSMTPEFKTTALKVYKQASVLRRKVQEACDEYAKVVLDGKTASRSMYVRDWLVRDMRAINAALHA